MLFRLYLLVASLAIIFVSFLGGYAMGFFDVLSGTVVGDAMTAARSLYFQTTASDDVLYSSRWNSRLKKGSGIVIHEADETYAGLTLYTSGHEAAAMLIDMDGEEVYRWELPFNEAWPDPDHLPSVASEEFIFWRKAVLYPNGDLLALYDGEGVTPSGHGLVKLDKDSNLIWKFSDATHHDVRIGPEDNIYTLTNTILTEEIPAFRNIEPPILNDEIVILNPDGQEIRRIDLLDAFMGTRFLKLLTTIKPDPLGDYFHTNALQPLTEEIAAQFDFAEAGQILVSMREMATIALVDPDSGKVVWAMRGPWIGQHDPDMLANGNIMIFDNRGGIGGLQGDSRVLEFDPDTHEITWSFSGIANKRFHCPIRSAQQRLPNGNTLITCSVGGQLTEVTQAGDIVWEFVNPVVGGAKDELLPIVAWGTRYTEAELTFLD